MMLSPVICILGPTAAGKTDLAFVLAERYPVHLISVDSAQIYRGMNIGSAKPSPETLARYPHALIDILGPDESYSAARFCADAYREIETAKRTGRIPVLVGGTMLYYYALFAGLADLPASDPDTRAAIEERIASEGTQALYDELVARDPETAARISANDKQRLIRFTELMQLSGKTPGELYARQHARIPANPILAFALNPERPVLHQRIAARFHAMIEQGFVEEVFNLQKNYPQLTPEMPSLKSVGYRQILQYLNGNYSLDEAVGQGIIATRQLAKRQITWINNRLKTVLPLQQYNPQAENINAVILAETAAFLERTAF